uniref:Transposase n=1 Tax=Panagrellus redivivus TaxID=6233 RepID=A0A7E4V6T8_PANRE
MAPTDPPARTPQALWPVLPSGVPWEELFRPPPHFWEAPYEAFNQRQKRPTPTTTTTIKTSRHTIASFSVGRGPTPGRALLGRWALFHSPRQRHGHDHRKRYVWRRFWGHRTRWTGRGTDETSQLKASVTRVSRVAPTLDAGRVFLVVLIAHASWDINKAVCVLTWEGGL